MVESITKYAIQVYIQLKRAQRKVERLEFLLNEVVKRIPMKDMEYYVEQTKYIDKKFEEGS